MDSPCDELHDFELIRRMAEQAVDFSRARESWACFYVRHYRFLLRLTGTSHGVLIGRDGVKDLVQEAFMKAFNGAATFSHAENCDAQAQVGKSRGWLARIVENLIRDRFRGQAEVCLTDEFDIERLPSDPGEASESNAPKSRRLELLESGFRLLTELEQTILRETMFWWRPDQIHQHMPHAALSQLSQQTGKSSANIRQIRVRAIKKLEVYVNDRFSQ
jgi:RNA polymerase sigma factor (sigma-70 family)